MIAEATAAVDSSLRMRDNALSVAIAQTTSEYLAATTSRRLVDLYEDSILPQAQLALESSLASYQVGRADFLNVRTNFITVLSYELHHLTLFDPYLRRIELELAGVYRERHVGRPGRRARRYTRGASHTRTHEREPTRNPRHEQYR